MHQEENEFLNGVHRTFITKKLLCKAANIQTALLNVAAFILVPFFSILSIVEFLSSEILLGAIFALVLVFLLAFTFWYNKDARTLKKILKNKEFFITAANVDNIRFTLTKHMVIFDNGYSFDYVPSDTDEEHIAYEDSVEVGDKFYIFLAKPDARIFAAYPLKRYRLSKEMMQLYVDNYRKQSTFD